MEKTGRDVIRFALCEPALLPMVWHQIGEYIEAALLHSANYDWHGGELFAGLARGDLSLLVAFKPASEGQFAADIMGGVVLRLGRKPDGVPYMAVMACGGRAMDEWIDLAVDVGLVLARRAQCEEVLVIGRPGWTRRLAHKGLRPYAMVARAAVPAEAYAGADEALLKTI